MKKVELLAPAGNYESFLGAICAGADAVYLGGEKFGARAYADNFTTQEACSAIRYAHVFGRKVYLALNTLVKESEFPEVYDYLWPFYEAGLDGVIIQDLGVFQAVGRWFPRLERHASTQMAVTGSLGAAYLKELGASRLVPARELSIEEIKKIKQRVDIEVEAFVHGAMCYCYSGQCLFSSILGGRSGNRGRCAQPCRLPYRIGGKGRKQYPLSLKDMCTAEMLDQLIGAGIDSFKIEGRMKNPEYTAGVTGIYRKYIDRYYEDPAGYRVEPQDMEKLRAMYIRSGISQGYYYRHNGKEMITLDAPGYIGQDGQLAEEIREAYLRKDFRLPVTGYARLAVGEPAYYVLELGRIRATIKGDVVQEAKNQPLTEENVRKQLARSGNTPFYLERLTIRMPEDGFLPVKALNDLRRAAFAKLESETIKENGFYGWEKKTEEPMEPMGKVSCPGNAACGKKGGKKGQGRSFGFQGQELHVLALTKEHCLAAAKCGVGRIYIDADIGMDEEWLESFLESMAGTECYLALPYILRQRDGNFLPGIRELLQKPHVKGALVRNLEELQFLKECEGVFPLSKERVSDAGLYAWNKEAHRSLRKECGETYLPYELNSHEIRELAEGEGGFSMVAYGRIPMMVSANCVADTAGECHGGKQSGWRFLADRYGKEFPVFTCCAHCYNIIYNSLPLSLHQSLEGLKKLGLSALRLDLTVESGREAEQVIGFWQKLLAGGAVSAPYGDYTNGHWKRGVE